jgi:hypothetical protein
MLNNSSCPEASAFMAAKQSISGARSGSYATIIISVHEFANNK